MSSTTRTPATPDQVAGNTAKPAIKPAVPMLGLLGVNSAAQAQNASLHEPSPASTYGDTVGSSSIPATPQTDGASSQGKYDEDLVKRLEAAQFDDAIASIGFRKPHSNSESRLDTTRIGALDPFSPSQAGGTGRYQIKTVSASSSPTGLRKKKILESPTWRKGGFVQDSSSQGDDPFVNDMNAGKPEVKQVFQPRGDRAGIELNGDTAQAILPPNACVFVANLSQTRTDEQLEYSVSHGFGIYGTVYVKIRRDSRGMPFAFCQYENVYDCEKAIEMGRGQIIDGRPCRTERAKVNRSLYLSRVTGNPIGEDEARHILAPYGELEKVWYSSQTDREMFRLQEGIWVMFAFFQDCRDAQAGFRENPRYRLEQPPTPEELRSRIFVSDTQTNQHRGRDLGFLSPAAMARRVADRCSIFVGNLPPKVTQEVLIEIFGVYGRIRGVEIVSKPSVNIHGVNVFAFIEFSSEADVTKATQGEHSLGGTRLRVERKESTEQLSHSGSPVYRRNRQENRFEENVSTYYNRAIAFGMSPGAANQMLGLGPMHHHLPAQTMAPPPVYAPYGYYSPYYQTQYAAPPYAPVATNGEHDGASSHTQPAMHPTQQMGPFQYPQVSVPYAPYVNAQYAGAPYVYPPLNSEASDSKSGAGNIETR